MSRRFSAPRIRLFLLVGAVLGAGCGPTLPPMTPVKGKVTVDGQPVTSGQVSYLPADNKTGAGLSAGTINASGEYEIHTAGQSGAPLGKYKVTVTPSMVPTQGATGMPTAAFNTKYQNVDLTPLSIEVVNNAEAGHYDLKLTK